jgi:predicted transglutaminase-like cysteine proteinase
MMRLCLSRLVCCLVCVLLLHAPFPHAWAAQQHDPFERLFGHTAFPAAPEDFPVYIEQHWTKVLQTEQTSPCLQRNTSCLPPADAPQWLYLARKAPTMDEMTLLRTVTAFFNKFPSASDLANYGVDDRWPTLADFFSHRSGDCKAYTLSKYFALRALGLQDDQLRIVLVHLPKRKANHAMLAVSTAKGVFILDNNTRPLDLILPQDKFSSQCIPLFMLNEKGRWTFRPDTELLRAK